MFDQTFNSTRKELWATNYPAYLAQEILIWRNVRLPRLRFKSSAAIIFLDLSEEDGKEKIEEGGPGAANEN